MEPANGVDIMEGIEATILTVLGGFIIIYKLDLFYTVYHFIIKPKTVVKSILNILSNLSLLLIFFSKYYKNVFEEDVLAPLIMLFAYVVLRIISAVVSTQASAQKQ